MRLIIIINENSATIILLNPLIWVPVVRDACEFITEKIGEVVHLRLEERAQDEDENIIRDNQVRSQNE